MNPLEGHDAIRERAGQIALIQDAEGLGTGVVVSPDGWILTNKHVAPNAGPFRVVLASGQNVHGVGVHQSAHHDLAMVKVAVPTGASLDLERDVNDTFAVGDVVYALGHPRGCRFSVARGIISNPHREFDKEFFIQTDVSINPGNSGGPLVDESGRLVGIVTMQLTLSQGLGFAVPAYTAADYVRYVHRLIRQGVVKVPSALLEAASQTVETPVEVVRRALDMVVEQGRVHIDEERFEDGYTRLKRRGAVIEVRCDGGAFEVVGKIAALGPSERGDAHFLGRLLALNATRELGGAAFGVADNELRVSITRTSSRLDAASAFEAIDTVSHLAETWGEKITSLYFEERPSSPAPTSTDAPPPEASAAIDPGYPVLQAPPKFPW